MYYMKTIKKKKKRKEEMNKTHTHKKLAKILVRKEKILKKNKTKETC